MVFQNKFALIFNRSSFSYPNCVLINAFL